MQPLPLSLFIHMFAYSLCSKVNATVVTNQCIQATCKAPNMLGAQPTRMTQFCVLVKGVEVFLIIES
jgi:hypothetical protein